MPKRSWDQLVEEGKRLLAEQLKASWHWGDLALEVEPMGESSTHSGSRDRLRRWAEEIGWFEEGYEFGTLLKYRETADRWPEGNRFPSVSFSAHYELRSHPDRFKLIRTAKTKHDAIKLAGRKVPTQMSASERVREALADPEVARAVMADPQVRHVVDEARPAEDRGEQARRLMRDPAVARAVVQDNTARSSMAKAAKEMEEEADKRQRERAPGVVGMSDFYEAVGEMSRGRRAHMKALDAMRRVDLDKEGREELGEHEERARLVLDWIRSYLTSGDHSFDKELDALLREEA